MAKQVRNFFITINNPFGHITQGYNPDMEILLQSYDFDSEPTGTTDEIETALQDYGIYNPKLDYQTCEDVYKHLESLPHVKYFIFQLELSKTKTPHIQLYLEFSTGKTFETVKGYLPTAHLDIRRGSKKQAREYCCKEDTRLSDKFYEYGTFIEERERTDWNAILLMIKSGATDEEIEEAYPSQFFMYGRRIKEVRQEYRERKFGKLFRQLEVTYIWGKAGTGKTRYVLDKYGYENVYHLSHYNTGCFDGYNGEDIIVFDEFRSDFKIGEMLKYLDGYPLRLPSRYNDKTACYTKVYIISNIPLSSQYKNIQDTQMETWLAFRRRIHHIHEMTADGFKQKLYMNDLIPIEDDGKLPF